MLGKSTDNSRHTRAGERFVWTLLLKPSPSNHAGLGEIMEMGTIDVYTMALGVT